MKPRQCCRGFLVVTSLAVMLVTIYSGDIQTCMYNHREPRNITFTVRYTFTNLIQPTGTFNIARSKYKGTGAGKAEKRRM